MKIFMCHLNAYQKVSIEEKTVSNQVDTMTQPEDAFPSPLWCVLSGTVNKVTVVEGMEAVHGFNNMGFPSLRPTWLVSITSGYASCPGLSQCPAPDAWHPSPGMGRARQASHHWQVDYTGPLPSWRVVGIDSYSACGLATSALLAACGVSLISAYLTNMTFNQTTHLFLVCLFFKVFF